MKNHEATSRVAKWSVLKTIRRARRIPASRSAVRKWTRRASKTRSEVDRRTLAMADAARPILRVKKIADVETSLPAKTTTARR